MIETKLVKVLGTVVPAAIGAVGLSKIKIENENKQPLRKDDYIDNVNFSPAVLAEKARILADKDSKIIFDFDNGLIPEELRAKFERLMSLERVPDYREFDDIDFEKEAALLSMYEPLPAQNCIRMMKNSNIKLFALILDKNKNVDDVVFNALVDIDAGYSFIQDDKIKNYINDKLVELAQKKTETTEGNTEFLLELEELANIVTAYNTLNSNYTSWKSNLDIVLGFNEYTPSSEFYNAIKSDKNAKERFLKELEKVFNNEEKVLPYALDFVDSQVSEILMEVHNDEIANYLYQNYYLKNAKISDEEKKLCNDILNDYGTKVLVTTYTDNLSKNLSKIHEEFYEWQSCSNNTATYPEFLNLHVNNKKYLYDTVGVTDNRNINLKGAGSKTIANVLRHEMAHLNGKYFFRPFSDDKEFLALVKSIMPSKTIIDIDGQKKQVLDFDNCKYREEFLKAGIPPQHIEYAYTNPQEFIAVAAEGNMQAYSEEFKEILIKFGLPEYVFEFQPIDLAEFFKNMFIAELVSENANLPYNELASLVENAGKKAQSPKK